MRAGQVRGSIITREHSKNYTIVLDLPRDPETGKRRQKWIAVKGTKKDAERKLAQLLHEMETGTYIEPVKDTVGQYLERWLRDYTWPRLSPKTASGYEDIVRRRLVPAFGRVPLTELRPEDIQAFYTKALASGRLDSKGGLSPNTVLRYHQCLHSALQSAVKWGFVGRNATDAVSPPKVSRKSMDVLDEDGIGRVLEAGRETPYYALFHCALFTGMRRGELLALRWCDVDLLLGQVSVSRNLQVVKGGQLVFRTPKSAKGRRTIALAPSSCVVLREHRQAQEALYTTEGRRMEETDLVFSHPDGSPAITPNGMTHAWMRVVRGLGLYVRLHDARHSHASLLLKQGVHPKVVQERLGHASIAITLDTYSHVSPGLQEAAALKFDQALAKPTVCEVGSDVPR